jgi:cilia- and flagella-associated protein 44
MMEASYIASEDESSQRTESFLYGLTESSRLESKMERLLNKYRERKAREEKRKYEWQQVNAEKPDPNQNHPDDDKALQEAENSIGDYKLKTDEAYDPPEDVRDTLFKKFDELLKTREEIFQNRKQFNDEVSKLRDKKLEIEEYIIRKTKELAYIHQSLAEDERKLPTVSVTFCDEREFPEKLLDLAFYSKRKQSIQEQHLQERQEHVIPTHPEDIRTIFLQPLEEKFDFDGNFLRTKLVSKLDS